MGPIPCGSVAACGAFAALVLSNRNESGCQAIENPPQAINTLLVKALRARIHDLIETSDEARWLDDGDFTLHRFLVSRNYNLADAEEMFRSTVEWRSRHDVRRELERWRLAGKESDERLLGRSYGYAARAGFTEDGAPLNIERVGAFDIAGCVRVPGMTDVVAKAYIMYLEETFQACREQSTSQGRYVRGRVVTDAAGVGLAHVKHSRLMRDVVAVGQRNYPELVQSVLVVHAPVAMHTLWNFGIKWVLPERSRAKVRIVGYSFKPQLSEMRVDPARLPSFLRGASPPSLHPTGAVPSPHLPDSFKESELMAQPVPPKDTIGPVPAVGFFGRVRETAADKAKSRAASLRDGMSGLVSWASSSAD